MLRSPDHDKGYTIVKAILVRLMVAMQFADATAASKPLMAISGH